MAGTLKAIFLSLKVDLTGTGWDLCASSPRPQVLQRESECTDSPALSLRAVFSLTVSRSDRNWPAPLCILPNPHVDESSPTFSVAKMTGGILKAVLSHCKPILREVEHLLHSRFESIGSSLSLIVSWSLTRNRPEPLCILTNPQVLQKVMIWYTYVSRALSFLPPSPQRDHFWCICMRSRKLPPL